MAIWLSARVGGSRALCHLAFGMVLLATSATGAAEQSRTFTVNEFDVVGANPLAPSVVDEILQPYRGDHDGLLGIRNAASALEDRLRARGYAFHHVVIPPQSTRTGEIRLEVVTYEIGSVKVSGNEYFGDANIAASVPALQTGKTPNARELARAMRVANVHPIKQVGVTIERADRAGKVDATLNVNDGRPYRIFSSVSNRGSEETGEERVSVGFQHGNVFGRDHIATFSYTTAPENLEDVRQYGLNYEVPLYGTGGLLSAFYSYSDVDTGTVADFFEVSGRGEFFGLRYDQYLLQIGDYRQRIRVSVENRSFDNDVSFLGRPIGSEVVSNPLGFQYFGEWVLGDTNVGFNVGYFRNVDTGGDNDQAAYAGTRVGAEANWDLFRYEAFIDRSLPYDFLFRGRYTGQYANEALIPGEQFGLGGARSVRGFRERELSADDGHHLSTELWLPPNPTDVGLLLFWDGALGTRRETEPGEAADIELSSVGAGARWQPNNHFSASLDYGYVLTGAGRTSNGESRIHFNVFMRY